VAAVAAPGGGGDRGCSCDLLPLGGYGCSCGLLLLRGFSL
jgi:hypothetical protein